jgi:hypothetical protein
VPGALPQFGPHKINKKRTLKTRLPCPSRVSPSLPAHPIDFLDWPEVGFAQIAGGMTTSTSNAM